MASDIPHLYDLRCTGLHHRDDGQLSAQVADGMDSVVRLYGDIPGGSGMSRADNTGASMVGEEVLRKCLEESQAQICNDVSDFLFLRSTCLTPLGMSSLS